MFAKATLRHAKSSGPHRRRLPRPAVEELEPRLTPAEVGLNDFRLSFMGPDSSPNFGASDAAVAYNSRNNEYLVVWSGDDVKDGEFEIYGQRVSAATGALIGGEIRLSDMGPDDNADFDALHPAVAYNGASNEYLVVWEGNDTAIGDYEIYGQRLDAATGLEVGANDFGLSDMGPNADFDAAVPAVAYNGASNEYLVVWAGDDTTDGEFEIYGQRLSATGAEVGANDFRISDMGPDTDPIFFASDPAVAYNGAANQYLVVWQGNDSPDGGREVFGQRLAATGAEVGANDFRLSDMGPEGNYTFAASSPAVAYNGAANEYLVVWHGDDTTIQEFEIFGQRVSAATGVEVGANDFRISDMGPDGNPDFDASEPAVAYNGKTNEYLVVWQGDDNTNDEFEVFGQRLAATGAQLGDNDFRLSDMGPDGDTRFGASTPAVAYNGAANQYLIAWQGDDNTAPLVDNESEIFGQRFAAPAPLPQPQPPSSGQPGQPQIVAEAFRRKGVARVRVRDAATGAVRAVLTPFKGYRGRLRLLLRDLNGDGSLDLLVQALPNGKRRRRAYDARTLAPLPPGPP